MGVTECVVSGRVYVLGVVITQAVSLSFLPLRVSQAMSALACQRIHLHSCHRQRTVVLRSTAIFRAYSPPCVSSWTDKINHRPRRCRLFVPALWHHSFFCERDYPSRTCLSCMVFICHVCSMCLFLKSVSIVVVALTAFPARAEPGCGFLVTVAYVRKFYHGRKSMQSQGQTATSSWQAGPPRDTVLTD